jgi:uncharacterized OsmC-like protein
MKPEDIRRSVAAVIDHFRAHPHEAMSEDKPARALLESGLRFRVEGPNSWVITTDMTKALGGDASAPSPGWLRRAAQAACEATMVAIRAAQEGVQLDTLEVTIGSISDDRGMLGDSGGIHPGPTESRAHIKVSSKGTPEAKLREIVEWAEQHSPVTDSLARAVPHSLEIEIA